MAAFPLLVASMTFSLTSGATAESAPLVNSQTMKSLFGSVGPAMQVLATVDRKMRTLAAGDECAVGDSLGVQDKTYFSAGCYVDTAMVDGYLYTTQGVEPLEDGTGWDQGIIYAVSALPSMSSSSLNSYSTTSGSNGKPSIGDPTSTNPDDNPGSDNSDCDESAWKGDGACDPGNNNRGCEFDGGDCCECTCVSTNYYTCGEDDQGFNCYDPDAPCANDDDYQGECELPAWQSDGYCDAGNNNAGCDYDGGDCCECSCVDTDDYVCGDGPGFNCVDPNPVCANDTSDDLFFFNSSSSVTEMFWISTYLPAFDGQSLKLTTMQYLCASSSVEIGANPANAASWSCAILAESSSGGTAVFDEVPESSFSVQCGCNTSTSDATSDGTTADGCEDFTLRTNGFCDEGNNNAGCDYDGGDCCECTCETASADNRCESFNCLDPNFTCDDIDLGDDRPTKDENSNAVEDNAAASIATARVLVVVVTMVGAGVVSVLSIL